ncbi:MAG: 30S ribosomal protein S1 [Oscillatoriales cyanobacterium]|nr:MAG: 30S ribosomal protein S1 [Oscillatoriales cyanobacterium]
MTRELAFSADDFAKALEGQNYNYEKGQIVTGKVCEHDTQGVYVDIAGKCPGFLPLKEIVPTPSGDLAEILPLGLEREYAIVRGANADGQVTLSIRQLELDRIWEMMAERQASGATINAQVTGTNRGGVVVDAESIRGFIPRSHLLRSDNMEALMGQTLTVTVLEVNPEKQKLVLSHRLAERANCMSNLEEGGLFTGTVVSIKPYGAFVDLGGVTGLLHARQISQKRPNDVEEVLTVGQEIKVIIGEIDEWEQKISLVTKTLETYPGEILEKFEAVMEAAEERWAAAKEAKGATVNKPEAVVMKD